MDDGFNPKRFTDPELRREKTLSDNKEYIYRLSHPSQKEWQNWQKDTTWLDEGTKRPKSPKESKAEFIRDVISFANAARRYGEYGYILFGIEDSQEILVGIDGQCTNPNTSLNTHKQKQIDIENEKSFNRVLRQYVHPKPEIKYKPDYIDGKLFGYLEIKPQYTPQPYQVREHFETGVDVLAVGDCWIREGESKYFVQPHEKQYLYNWTQVPPVGLENWASYFTSMLAIPGRPATEIVGYQDLLCDNGNELANEVKLFLEAPDKRILIINGQAGCGKSVFIKNFAHQLAGNVLAEVNNEKFINFTNPVPIFLSLNNFIASQATPFERELLHSMVGKDELFNKYPQEPERLFESQGQRWVVLLDAFDEVNIKSGSPSILWGLIQKFIRKYSNIKVIITTRPDTILANVTDIPKVTVAPLTEEQIWNFLHAHLGADIPNTFEEIEAFLNTEQELWQHLCYPLFLGTAANYFSGGEMPDPVGDENFDTDVTETTSEAISPSKQSVEQTPTLESDSTFSTNIRALIENVKEQSEDEAELPLDLSQNDIDKNQNDDVTTHLRMGQFLDDVFKRLWRYNAKKRVAGFDCGSQDHTFEALGELAAKTLDKTVFRQRVAEQWLKTSIDCVLDLGLLVKNKPGVKFPTFLSKTYFAAHYVNILLVLEPEELDNLINGPPDFWTQCYKLLNDFSQNDLASLEQKIASIGENNNG